MNRLLPISPDALPKHMGLKNNFKVQRIIFATLGMDPTSLENFIFNPVMTFLPILSIMCLCGPMVSLALKSTNDLNLMANIMGPMWQSFLASSKFVLFLSNRKRIALLIRKMWKWNLEANSKEMPILLEEIGLEYKVSFFFCCSVLMTGFLALVAPFGVAGLHAWMGEDFYESLDLPLKADYFLDAHKSYLNYGFDYIWSFLGIYAVVQGSIAIDTLFTWYIRNISARFRILNLHISEVAESRKRQNFCSEKFSKSIIECIHYHREVIDLADQLNIVFRPIIFFKFLISCLQLATLTFQFSQPGEFADLAFSFSFLMSVTIQLMLYCYGGQRIQEMSTSVSSHVYQSFTWHDINIKNKKMLLLVMMRADKPCTLTGIFFIVDLSLFVWVYRTAVSFLTMMISMDS